MNTAHQFPIGAASLDEIVLAFPVHNGSIVGLDADLGFHMYGSEVCLAARDDKQAAVIIDAPCLHNSESGYQLDHTFVESAQRFARMRGGEFPYASTCVEFKANGQIAYW
ncbi:hypothetical protein AJ87_24880 [Rhizobium yanglingense]|nr:hypothetical protein AJ87_24880 [Rhizobium yanglingense]